MNQDIQRQKALIEASGMGLLPGIALALAVAVLATGALVLESWIFTVAALVFVLGTAACIAAIVALLSEDD